MESRGPYGGERSGPAPHSPYAPQGPSTGSYGRQTYGGQPHGGGAPAYGGPPDQRPVEIKERPFGIALLIAVVTLTIYHYFWHWFTHDELAKQMGVENKAKPIWIAYIALALIGLVLSFLGPDAADLSEEPTLGEVLRLMEAYLPFVALSGVITLVSFVFFVIYVVKQWALVTEAKQKMGLRVRGSTGAFFLLYFGSFVVVLLLFWLIIPVFAPFVMIPIAYYLLNENYNDIARAIRHRQVDPAAYAPGGEGWQYGPYRPHGHTPPEWAGYGAAAGAGSPGYAALQEPYGGVPSSSWDDPHRHSYTPSHEQERLGRGPATAGAGFSVNPRREEEEAFMEQNFQCPRCHHHVGARGAPGTEVAIHCPRCGESGSVRLPES